MNPEISVIVPVYNVEKYVARCIDSIITQSYKNIEIILVNDGAEDSSLEICEYYKNKDNRIILISQRNNGLSMARNRALDVANGNYIGFVDSDDWIEKDMFELLYTNMVRSNADISTCGFSEVYENDPSFTDLTLKDVHNELRIIEGEDKIKCNLLDGNSKDRIKNLVIDALNTQGYVLRSLGAFIMVDGKSIDSSIYRQSYDLSFLKSIQPEYAAFSFVETEQDVEEILTSVGETVCKIIAKIETLKGVENICSILNACDGIMIARGDLGIHIVFYLYRHQSLQDVIIKILDKPFKNMIPRQLLCDVEPAVIHDNQIIINIIDKVCDVGKASAFHNDSRADRRVNRISPPSLFMRSVGN